MVASSINVTFITVRLPITSSTALYPINEIISLFFAGTEREKNPLASVIVPEEVPATFMEAPIIGTPVMSTTFPVMFLF